MKILLFVLFLVLVTTFIAMFLIKERNRGVYPGLHRAPVAEKVVKKKEIQDSESTMQITRRSGKVQLNNEGRKAY